MLWWSLRKLKSSQWETRAAAAADLGRSRETAAVAALIETLQDESPQVRLATISALGKIGAAQAVTPLISALTSLSKASKTKGSSKNTGSTGDEYLAIASALANLAAPAVQPLITLLSAGEKEVRRWSAFALGQIKDPRAVTPLAERLEDGRLEVRKAATAALASIGDRRALQPLTRALAAKDPETKKAAAQALAELGGVETIEALSAALADRDETVQLAVLDSIKKIGGSKAAICLRPALESDRKAVRDAAASILKSMQIQPACAEECAALAVLNGNFEDALREGASATNALLEALGSKVPGLRRQAAESLGRLRAEPGIKPLLRALRDHDEAVREAAARALAAIGKPAVEGLRDSLASLDATEEYLAARALGEISDVRAIKALAETIEKNKSVSSSYPVPIEAARAAAEALTSILNSSSESIGREDLVLLLDLPDAVLVHPPAGELPRARQEIAVDCSALRTAAELELSRRRSSPKG
jgi:HEAT repeat protein